MSDVDRPPPFRSRSRRALVGRYWPAVPFVGVFVFSVLGFDRLATICFFAAFGLAVGTVAFTVVRGRFVRRRLARDAGLAMGSDQTVVLAARAHEVRAVAETNGWQMTADSSGPLPLTTAVTCNVCAGSSDGHPFRLLDALEFVVQEEDHVPRSATLASALTAVQLDFPAPFRLVVAEKGSADSLTLSSVGPSVPLESGDFDGRFHTFSDDPVRARVVLNPAAMSDLLAFPGKVRLTIDRGEFELSTPGSLMPAARLTELVGTAVRLRTMAEAART